MTPPAVVGVDPGAAQTGIVLRVGDHPVAACVIEPDRSAPAAAYLTDVLDTVGQYLARVPGSVVAIEDYVAPQHHIDGEVRFVSPKSAIGTCLVLGAVLGRWPDAVVVRPGGNGSAPLSMYPAELVGKTEKKGGGWRRHTRSAWDVAGKAMVELRQRERALAS